MHKKLIRTVKCTVAEWNEITAREFSDDARVRDEYIDKTLIAACDRINATPFRKTDISQLDDAGRALMMRFRDEYTAPVELWQEKKTKVFCHPHKYTGTQPVFDDATRTIKTYACNGTRYHRDTNIWEDIDAWIMREQKWCAENDIATDRNWDKKGGVQFHLKLCKQFHRMITPAVVERTIAAFVMAYTGAHKNDLLRSINDRIGTIGKDVSTIKEYMVKPIANFTPADEAHCADKINEMTYGFINRTNELDKARWALESKIKQRPIYLACGIKDLPPTIKNKGALAGLEFACVELGMICTKEEFRKMSLEDIKAAFAKSGSDKEQILAVMEKKFAETNKTMLEIKSGVDLMVNNQLSDIDPEPLNDTARAHIVKLWDDFRTGELDAQFDGKPRRRDYNAFISWCGNLKAYDAPDGTIRTVNDCLPDGVEQLKNLMHAEAQNKHVNRNFTRKKKRA